MKQLDALAHAISSAFLQLCGALAPHEKADWAAAMSAEGEVIRGSANQLAWSIGCLLAIGRAHIAILPKRAAERPLVVNAACLYWMGFSAYLIGAIAFQIVAGRIREPWTDAIVPVILMLALSAFPSVVALGLWLLDDSARLLCMAFCFAHAMSCFAWMSRPGVHAMLPSVRIIIDLAMIAAMNSRTVRRAFCPRGTALRLRSVIQG